MRVESVVGVDFRGDGMVRGRSGMEAVKRIMRLRGVRKGEEGEEVMAGGVACWNSSECE